MTEGYFITGTDTGVGKTWVTITLMRYFALQEKRVVGMKPVASGCSWIDGQLKNSDALLIQQYCTDKPAYELINPYAYESAISPHIAGVDNPARLPTILEHFERLKSGSDSVIVEGAGGWYSFLSGQLDNADLALALRLPVILVVAIRLGCINQARLSFQAIVQSGGNCAGWIAMCVEPELQALEANIDCLNEVLTAPLLAVLPYVEKVDFDTLAKHITLK